MDIIRPVVPIGTHPVDTGDYVVATNEINRLYDEVSQWIENRSPGGIIFGRPRLGKTRAVRYLKSFIQSKEGLNLLAFHMRCPECRKPNEAVFFEDLLKSVGHDLYLSGKANIKRDRLYKYLLEQADRHKQSKIILFIDDAQRLYEVHYGWLMDIYNELESVIGMDIKELNIYNIKSIITTLPKDNDLQHYMHENLFFCCKCMSIGYHSIYHQLKLIEKCPYHDEYLTDKCPKCAKTILYELNERTYDVPFKCSCGFSYFSSNTFTQNYNIWEKSRDLRVSSEKFYKWLSLNSEQKEEFFSLSFNKSMKKQSVNNIIDYTLTLTDDGYKSDKNIIHHKKKICNQRSITKLPLKTRKKLKIINKLLDATIYNQYLFIFETFFGIKSSIRTLIAKKHKECFKDYLKSERAGYSLNNLCPNIYAFLFWSKLVDCFEFYWLTFFGLSEVGWYNAKRMRYDDYMDFSVLDELADQWYKYIHYEVKDLSEFNIIFRNVMRFILINHYNNVVEVAKKNHEKASRNIILPECKLTYENINLYAIKQTDSEQPCIEFHWWDKNIYDSRDKISW